MSNIPEEVKQKESLNAFKDAIKNGHRQISHVNYAKTFTWCRISAVICLANYFIILLCNGACLSRTR